MGDMRFGLIVFGLSLCFLSWVSGGPVRRSKDGDDLFIDNGVNYGFTVIANASLPCAEFMPLMQSLGQNAPYQLTEEDKADVIEAYGIEFPRKYLAASEQQAREHFVNLLPLSHQEVTTLTKGKLNKGRLLKETVRKGLEVFNIKKLKQLSPADNDAVEEEAPVDGDETESVPLVIPDEDMDDQSVLATGTQSYNFEYCFDRGTPLYGGQYLRLCSICSATRTMTADYWPRYINEAVCSPTDLQCLVGTTEGANGGCQQILIPINLLKKSPDKCVLAMHDGQTLIAEEWEVTMDMIPVGCECAVLSSSHLARYA